MSIVLIRWLFAGLVSQKGRAVASGGGVSQYLSMQPGWDYALRLAEPISGYIGGLTGTVPAFRTHIVPQLYAVLGFV